LLKKVDPKFFKTSLV